jgi:hypothetical protein
MLGLLQRHVPDAKVSCVGRPRLASNNVSNQNPVLCESLVSTHFSGIGELQ